MHNEKNLTEKEQIEKATAEAFIPLYNKLMRASFKIVEHSDAPDFRCVDSQNNELKLEITLTEDRPKDIAALCGRSDHRSLESLKEHLRKVKEGKAHPLQRVSCLSGNVMAMAVDRIKKKMNKDYGKNTALVVGDTSGCNWDWDMEIEGIGNSLDLSRNPYDKGIWIISKDKTNIFRID
jgi:hypothetical protein